MRALAAALALAPAEAEAMIPVDELAPASATPAAKESATP